MNLMVVKDRHLNLPSFLHVDSVLLPFLDHLVSLENKSGIFGGVRHGQFGSFCHGPHREFPFFHQDDLGGAFLGQSNLCVNCWWRRKKIAAAFPLSSRADSVTEVKVLQTNVFARAYKKLHPKRKDAVDKTVASIIQNPNLGEEKKSELAGVFVYKFDCVGQLNLLAYEFDPSTRVLLLVGTHENFYRTLKR